MGNESPEQTPPAEWELRLAIAVLVAATVVVVVYLAFLAY
jgi:hypothetical protein